MFRRAIVRRMSITAAKALFLASDGAAHAQPRAPLPSILEALSEHGLALDERCMTTALAHVMELDRTNEDSLVVGKAEVLRPSSGDTIRLQTTSATSTSDSNTTSPPAALLVVELMKRFPNSPTVRASCCRCIANLCQASGTTPQHNNTAGTPSAHDGDRLVEQGAMEQVIGTLDMYARLNGKERCRAAMAALNLCCLTHEGVSRAVACNAESSLSEFILAMVAEIRDGRPTSEDDLLPGLTHEMCMALDAALGALCAVLAGQAPENSRGISFNFEQASYLAVDALVQALMAMSGVLLRDGRNNGAYDATLSFKRQQIGSGLAFARASPLQQTAVAALLPLLHKAWMGLQSVCGHAPNLPMVYQSIYDVGLGHGGAPAGESRGGDWQRTIDASIFLAVELEGLEAVEELATLQAATRGFLLGCLSPLSAPRKPSPGDEEASGEADPGQLTVAGQSVMEVMTSGTASALALATLVRLHAEHEESLLDASPNVGTSKEVCCAYSADNFHIFSNALLVLSHLGEAGDESVYGSNTVAALHVLLNGASDGIRSLPYLYKDQLFELFRPTSLGQKFEEAAAASGEGVKEGCISADHRLSFLQQSAIVGQVYAVLWSVLRTTNGVTAVVELQLAEAVEAIQTSLQTSYLPAIEEARKAYAKEAAAAAAASAELTAGQPSIKSSSEKESSGDWIPNTAEETVVRLRRLGAETMDQLQSLARAKTSANNSRTTS